MDVLLPVCNACFYSFVRYSFGFFDGQPRKSR